MNILISGGTGVIGRLLVPELEQAKYDVYIIGRDEKKIKAIYPNKVHAITWDSLKDINPDEFAAIINLAGENIADNRWSTKVKERMLASRVNTTEKLVAWAINAKNKKPHLYNASAVSIYGLQKQIAQENHTFTESTPLPCSFELSFSTQMVSQWEEAAKQGAEKNMPLTLMRFGVVLKRGAGMLKKLELPAQFGMGSVLGSGEQPLAWIDSTDLVRAIMFLLLHPEITGPVNLVAPERVSQKQFTKTMAQVLKKPALLWFPSALVRTLFGQMGDELLLSGQTVTPQRLTEHHFHFNYPTLLSALTKEFAAKES